MSANPGSLAAQAPQYPATFQSRKARDAERALTEQAAAKTGQAMQIGAGGILVDGGGSITIQGTGTFNTNGAITTAGAFTAGTTITAGSNIVSTAGGMSAPGVISGGAFSTGGGVSAGSCSLSGNLTAANVLLGGSGTVYSTFAYSNPVVTGYLAAYINGPDGRFGATPSALRFKQDITQKVYTVAEAVKLSALVVNYRLIEAVNMYGDDAPTEVGVIAESLIAAGFPEFVAFDAQGNTLSVHYERLCLVVMGAFAELVGRVEALEGAA